MDVRQKMTAAPAETKPKHGKGKKKVTFEGSDDKRKRKFGVQGSSDDQSQPLHCSQESLLEGSRSMRVDDREIKDISSNIVHGIINENETEVQGKRKDRRKAGNEGRRKAAQRSTEGKEKPGFSSGRRNQGAVAVAKFDACIENHLRSSGSSFVVEEGGSRFKPFERLLSGITFLRDWQSYCRYANDLKAVKFAYENKDSQIKETSLGTMLPQFSAAIPRLEKLSSNNSKPANSSNDFILNVGGSVWILD